MKKTLPDPEIVAVDAEGNRGDLSVLEENDIAFDATKATLDLTKAEKRRTTALMLAIQAYSNLIIKDAEMYRAVATEAARGTGPIIQPATMNAMVEAAIQFDLFISGAFAPIERKPQSGCATPEPPSTESSGQTKKES